jgi:hypothetical protein
LVLILLFFFSSSSSFFRRWCTWRAVPVWLWPPCRSCRPCHAGNYHMHTFPSTRANARHTMRDRFSPLDTAIILNRKYEGWTWGPLHRTCEAATWQWM